MRGSLSGCSGGGSRRSCRRVLLKLERVSQDGMRVRVSAGASSFGRRETLNDHLREAEGQIERLKHESEGHPSAESAARAHRSAREAAAQGWAARERSARVKRALALLPEAEKALQRRTDRRKPGEARTSSTDPEARVMKLADGGFRPAYNAQVVCDAESLLVGGVDVGNVGSDMGLVPPMLDQLQECFAKLPKELLCDGGYPSRESLKVAHARGVTVYAPVPKARAERDRYAPRADDSEARAAWRKGMSTDEAKAIYKQRAATIEWVNACFRRFALTAFPVRGIAKARAVLLLTALAHNLFRVEGLRQKQALGTAA